MGCAGCPEPGSDGHDGSQAVSPLAGSGEGFVSLFTTACLEPAWLLPFPASLAATMPATTTIKPTATNHQVRQRFLETGEVVPRERRSVSLYFFFPMSIQPPAF